MSWWVGTSNSTTGVGNQWSIELLHDFAGQTCFDGIELDRLGHGRQELAGDGWEA